MIAITHLPSPRMKECEVTHIVRQTLDLEVVAKQHEAYRRLLTRCGADVRVLDVNSQYPDCIFVEDNAVVLDEIAIIASPGAPSRRAEPAGIEAELRKYRPIARITLPATLEGGDVLRVGRTLLVGASSRTNELGIEALRRLAPNYEVVAIPVSGCLHLKSACTALPDGRLLVNRAWLDIARLARFELVDVPKQEPHAANVVVCLGHVCMADAYPRTAQQLVACGFDVSTIDLSELAKAEGAATCLSLLVPPSAKPPE